MKYLWRCDREEFVDFLSSRKPAPKTRVEKSETLDKISVRGDDVILVWNSRPTDTFSLPRAAIVAEGKSQDFLAWCSTYFRNIRPFTAHCRVESLSSARLADSSIATDWTTRNRSVDLGLIITEAISYSIGRTDINRLPFSAFTRTMSYAIAKAVRHYPIEVVAKQEFQDRVEHGWNSTRQMVGNVPLELSSMEVRAVWEIVLSCEESKSSGILNNALCELKHEGRISKSTWKNLIPNDQVSSELWAAMEGPREGRVLAVDYGLRILRNGTKTSRTMRAFAAGYLASRVRPGSLDHLSLVFPICKELRESLLWYGVCAGFVPETTVDSYANGLGWLMRRELGRPSHWLERPSCDIAFAELKTLWEGRESGKPEFRTISRGVLEVEILPLITTNVRWNDQPEEAERIQQRTGKQRTFFEEQGVDLEVAEILRKVEESTINLNKLRDYVERVLGVSDNKREKRKK